MFLLGSAFERSVAGISNCSIVPGYALTSHFINFKWQQQDSQSFKKKFCFYHCLVEDLIWKRVRECYAYTSLIQVYVH